MNKHEAIEKVGRHLGEDMFYEYMSGGYAIAGFASPAQVLQLIYGGNTEAIALELREVEKKTFNLLRKEQSSKKQKRR